MIEPVRWNTNTDDWPTISWCDERSIRARRQSRAERRDRHIRARIRFRETGDILVFAMAVLDELPYRQHCESIDLGPRVPDCLSLVRELSTGGPVIRPVDTTDLHVIPRRTFRPTIGKEPA